MLTLRTALVSVIVGLLVGVAGAAAAASNTEDSNWKYFSTDLINYKSLGSVTTYTGSDAGNNPFGAATIVKEDLQGAPAGKFGVLPRLYEMCINCAEKVLCAAASSWVYNSSGGISLYRTVVKDCGGATNYLGQGKTRTLTPQSTYQERETFITNTSFQGL